jgi:plastocyanin
VRKAMPVLTLLLLVLGLAACGSDSSETSTAKTTSSTSAKSTAPTLAGKVTDKGTEDARTLDSLEVEADDFYFKPTYVQGKPGQTLTIELHNEGEATHTFTVDSLGIDEELSAGATKDVSVTLPDTDGTVEFHCDFHVAMGMRGAFLVGTGAGGAAGTGTGSSSTTSTTTKGRDYGY